MARDMWTMINRELAKLESARGGASATPQLDMLRETMQYAKEDRAWKERKNLQRQELMGRMAQGTNMTFNADDLEDKTKQFQNYFNKYQGQFDEETMELGQMYINQMQTQKEKNENFELMNGQLETLSNKQQATISEIGIEVDADGNKVSRTLNNDDLKLIDEMNTEYLDYRSKFLMNHADRLSLKPYQHISTKLDAGKQMNTFLVQEAYEDNLIDAKELEAWTQSWDGETLEPIQTYRNKQNYIDKAIVEKNTKDITAFYDEYNQLNDWMDDKGAIPVQLPGDTKGTLMTWAQLQAQQPDLADAYDERLRALHNPITGEGKIMNLDAGIERQLGISWLKDQEITLPIASKEGREEAKRKEEIKGLIPELGGQIKPIGWKEGDPLVEREKGKLPPEVPPTEEEKKSAETLRVELEEEEKGVIAKTGDIAQDLGPYAPATYVGYRASKPQLVKVSKYVGEQLTKSYNNIMALTKMSPQHAVDWMGDGTVQKQVKAAQKLQDNVAKAVKARGPGSKAAKEATEKLDTYVAKTVKTLMKKKKLKGINAEQMTKLLKDTKKWSSLKLLASAYKNYPQLKSGFVKGLPGGGYATISLAQKIGEAVGDPTGGLATAGAGYWTYNKVKGKMSELLSTKAGRQKAAQKISNLAKRKMPAVASAALKKLAVSIGSGATVGGAPGAALGTILGTGMLLHDVAEFFFPVYTSKYVTGFETYGGLPSPEKILEMYPTKKRKK